MASAEGKETMRVQLFKGMHGRLKKHQASVRGLGIRRIHQVVEVEDTPATRGMLNRVSYMVREVREGGGPVKA